MTVAIDNKQHRIKLVGTVDDPYFCGKDVCNVLGYEAPSKALRRHVDEEDKNILSMINVIHDLGDSRRCLLIQSQNRTF
jgi:prophage antirepressor-like protein